jgi:hypothetical protein
MNTRLARSAGWVAIISGIASILGLVSLILFYGLESTPKTGQGIHIWGPVSDISPILQMISLLVVAHRFYRIQRSRAAGLSLIGTTIGMIGMLGVALLQLLLIIKVLEFEQEVSLVLLATAAVGVWLIFVNFLGRRQGRLPSRLTWLGIATGAAFFLEPLMLSAAGGALAWRVFMSNYLLMAGSAVVFLISYVGFPVWAFWLGREFLRGNGNVEHTIMPNSLQSKVIT